MEELHFPSHPCIWPSMREIAATRQGYQGLRGNAIHPP